MILNNQRGAALLISVLAVTIVIMIFNQTLNNKASSLNREVQRQNRISAGIQVMHDFAIIARKANELYIATLGVCGGTYLADTALPPRPFCWPTAGTPPELRCVNHPQSDPANPVTFCLTGANPDLVIGSNGKLLNDDVAWWEGIFSTAMVEEADAQESLEAHHPTLAGAPTNDITPVLPCNAGTAGGTYCKRCTGVPAVKNLDCVLLQVCMLALPGGTACANNQYLRQVIGLMPH